MPIYGILLGAVAFVTMAHMWWSHDRALALLEEALRRVSVEDVPQGPQYGADATPAMKDLTALVLQMDLPSVPDAHLLAVVLAGSTGGEHPLTVASHVLERANHDLDELARMDMSDLRGTGPSARARMQAMQELMRRRVSRLEQNVSTPILTPEQAASVIRTMTPDHEEALILLVLDRRRRLIGSRLISRGSSGFTIVDPASILRAALSHPKAAALVLGHNHPSGDAQPSPQDLEVTKVIKTAASSVGLVLLDHVITTGSKSTSLAARGRL